MAHTGDLKTRETLDGGLAYVESSQQAGGDDLEAQIAALWLQEFGRS